MGLVRKARSALSVFKQQGVKGVLALLWIKLRAAAAKNDLGWKILFECNPFVATGLVSDYNNSRERTWQQLRLLDSISLRELSFDREQFLSYVERAGYEKYDPYYRGGLSGNARHRTEKLIEHYLFLKLLDINESDVYVDVASNTSPMKDIVRTLTGATTYSMDLKYAPGVHSDQIGCDAGDTGLPEGFASKMSLHCSFEHFADGADMRFVGECGRILRPGGRVCIIPLYLGERYCIRQDPTLEVGLGVKNREGAKIEYVRDYRVDYGRFYDVQQFKRRVVDEASGLLLSVYRIGGLEALEPEEVYCNFALLMEKPR